MKRIFAVLLMTAMLLTLCLTLTGCDAPSIRVESQLNIDDAFRGTRTVTVIFPLSSAIDAVKDEIIADAPAQDTEGVSFTYLGAAGDGYSFELSLRFESHDQYEEQVSAVIGRDASAVLSIGDTVMFSGVRMAEDFSVGDLISWIRRDTAATEATKDYTFDYARGSVRVGANAYETGAVTDISDCTGVPVNGVDIKTYNAKALMLGYTFDRSFVFSIPADTYADHKDAINACFASVSGAQITDLREGSSVLYTLTFSGLSLSELEEATAGVLDSGSVSVYYGDKGSLSTPLFEGCVMEESLDTMSFCGADGNPPPLKYTYTLPTNAVRGEGAVFRGGVWESAGIWDDGAYRVEDTAGMTRLRIYDGRQYHISGADILLESLGKNKFRRTVSFRYPITDGFDGPVYATKFFAAKEATAAYDNDDECIICSVICEGSIDEINAALERIFGSGNYLSYERRSGALSDKTALTDTIDIRDLLGIENLTVPITYAAASENGENIVTLTDSGTETAYRGKDATRLTLIGGTAVAGYHSVIPKAGNILLYLIGAFVLTGSVILAAVQMTVRPLSKSDASSGWRESLSTNSAFADSVSGSAPTQTTTFSIAELGRLSRDKKKAKNSAPSPAEQEPAVQVPSVQEQSVQEPPVQELAVQEPPVEVQPVQEPAEPQAPPAEPIIDDAPRTIEILETLDQATKQETPQEPPADPIRLLDAMNEEDGDDQSGDI